MGKYFGDEVLSGATSQRATDVACDSASEELLTLLRSSVTADLETMVKGSRHTLEEREAQADDGSEHGGGAGVDVMAHV